MIGSHPRLGFAILGGMLAALITLGVLILHAGSGGVVDVQFAAAPSAADLPSPVALERTGARTRKPTGVDAAWVATVSAKVGIPAPALRAYADTELLLVRQQPGCHLAWNTLAGIGWVESHHGTIDGRTLLTDGRSSTPIIGPALDGTQFAAIHATAESTGWHGDPTWEHAVGPLQFIASTWDRWGADGDGDGVADPLDIDDAAFTAGRYLCADGHDLSTGAGWNAAVHSYNHDNAYVLDVLEAANTYASRTS